MDAMSTDDLASAQSHLSAALCQFRTMDYLDGLARCLGALSALALKREHLHLAARLIGTTTAARDSTGLTAWPTVTETERRTISRAAALLPGGEFAAQVSSGRAQTIEDAITQAMLTLESGRRPADDAVARSRAHPRRYMSGPQPGLLRVPRHLHR
jgi:hypothetical protein